MYFQSYHYTIKILKKYPSNKCGMTLGSNKKCFTRINISWLITEKYRQVCIEVKMLRETYKILLLQKQSSSLGLLLKTNADSEVCQIILLRLKKARAFA